MEQLAKWVFNMSWQAAILIALVLALRFLLGRKLTPAWRCALWALVAIRLLTPGPVPLPMSGSVTSPTPPPAAAPNTSSLTVTVTRFWDRLAPPTPGQNAGSGSDRMSADRRSAAPDSAISTPTPELPTLLSRTWLTVTLLLLARLAIINARLAWRLRRMKPVTDDRVLRAVHACASDLGVRTPIKVVTTAHLRTPAVWGVRRPVLMLPAACTLQEDDLQMVLLHELAHIRRKDLWIEWLTGLLKAIHWFNPLVWLAASACRTDRELACDQAVLRQLGPHRGRDYGACLLRLLQAVANLPPEPAAIGAFGTKGNLHRRITMIATYRGNRPAGAWLAGAIVFAAVACCAATGTASEKEPQATPGAPAAETSLRDKTAATSPTDATSSILEKRLAGLKFDQLPFSDVVDTLRDQTGANIFVNWRALAAAGIERNTPTTSRLRDVRFGKALDTILRDVGGGIVQLAFVAKDGVITISTAEEISRQSVIIRAYDIRDLLVAATDFVEFNVGPAATQPTNVKPTMTRADRVTQITSLVQEVVDPDSWRDAGGTIGSLREVDGQLIVSQTPENHAQVAQLLESLRESHQLQIAVMVRYIFVDQKTLDEMGIDWANDSVKQGKSTFVTDETVAAFLKATQKSKESKLVTAPRLTLDNGLRVRVAARISTAYVKDIVVVQTKDGETRYDPRMAEVQTGLTLDLEATASADRKSVALSIRSLLSALKEMKPRPFAGGVGGMQVQVPDVIERTTETSVSVPDGQTLMLIAMTPEAADVHPDKPKGQTFIFIKPNVLLPRETSKAAFPIP